MIPTQEPRRPSLGWNGDAQAEADIRAACSAKKQAWHQATANPGDNRARRAVRRAANELRRVQEAALDRYLERTVEQLEEQLHEGDQRGFYRHLTSFDLDPLRRPTHSTFETKTATYSGTSAKSANDG